jgi:hypothetical protein
MQQYRNRRRRQGIEHMKQLNSNQYKPKSEPVSTPQLLIATKDSIFESLDDVLQGNINVETFMGNNRMIYLGLTIICIAIFILVCTLIVS